MQTNQSDLKYLKQIAEIKWQKGFKCRKCKHREAYQNKVNYSMKCKQCKCVESVTANTAFAGLKKIALSRAVNSLIFLQENYIEWDANQDFTSDLYVRGGLKYLKDKKEMIAGTIARPPLYVLSEWLGVRSEAAWYFMKKITDWLPRWTKQNIQTPSFWFPHEKYENKMYNALFNLLFNDESDRDANKSFTPRTEEEILELLIFKKLLKREE